MSLQLYLSWPLADVFGTFLLTFQNIQVCFWCCMYAWVLVKRNGAAYCAVSFWNISVYIYIDFGGAARACAPPIIEKRPCIYHSLYHLSPNILVFPPNTFDKSTPVCLCKHLIIYFAFYLECLKNSSRRCLSSSLLLSPKLITLDEGEWLWAPTLQDGLGNALQKGLHTSWITLMINLCGFCICPKSPNSFCASVDCLTNSSVSLDFRIAQLARIFLSLQILCSDDLCDDGLVLL